MPTSATSRRSLPRRVPAASQKIAIIGAGPAGLSCAYYLAERGYKPTVLRKTSARAACWYTAFPSYKLQKDVVDAEIEVLRQMGVDIRCGVEVGRDITLDTLRREGLRLSTWPLAARTAAARAFPARTPRA